MLNPRAQLEMAAWSGLRGPEDGSFCGAGAGESGRATLVLSREAMIAAEATSSARRLAKRFASSALGFATCSAN